MSYRLSFSGEGVSVSIEVFDYENPLAQDPDDASWLKAAITVHAGPFSGTFKTTLTTHDLAVLYQRTGRALRSVSEQNSFETTEGDLTLNFQLSQSGKVQIDGVAQPHTAPKTALHYRFQSDPSALEQAVGELKLITERFPAKQAQS